jgi:hypothetical protein
MNHLVNEHKEFGWRPARPFGRQIYGFLLNAIERYDLPHLIDAHRLALIGQDTLIERVGHLSR